MTQQTQADRTARSLKRLGFTLSRKARTFRVIEKTGELAPGSGPAMTLAEIELWIANHIKPGRR
jgi:hypothetical protein